MAGGGERQPPRSGLAGEDAAGADGLREAPARCEVEQGPPQVGLEGGAVVAEEGGAAIGGRVEVADDPVELPDVRVREADIAGDDEALVG